MVSSNPTGHLLCCPSPGGAGRRQPHIFLEQSWVVQAFPVSLHVAVLSAPLAYLRASSRAVPLLLNHLLITCYAGVTMGMCTGVLKDARFALQRHFTQKRTPKKHEFGKTWQMWLALPQRGHQGHGNDESAQTWFAASEGSCGGVPARAGGRRWGIVI